MAEAAQTGTVTGKINNTKTLHAQISAQGNLKATVTPQRSLSGKVSKTIVPIDSELSNTSINPVQNRVVTTALNEKLAKNNIAKCSDIDKLF